jgi:hypothetical protein
LTLNNYVIQRLPLPTSQKCIPSFMGKIHFICKFVPDFVEIIKPIHKLLIKDVKCIQSFMGKINFICKFVPDFVEIIKPIPKLLIKDVKGTQKCFW